MTKQQLERFARQLVKDNCDLPSFEVDLPYDDLDEMEEALRSLGYRVERHETRPRLIVYCSDGAPSGG